MPEPESATSLPPKSPRTSFRIPQSKVDLAKAMLDSGATYLNVAHATGLSQPTIAKVKKQEITSTEQAEKIKKSLRNRFAIIADRSLSGLSDEKLEEASAKDLIYIASKATEMAGLSPPSIVETYTKSIQSFLMPETPQQVVGTETVTKTVSQPITDNS